MFYTYIHLRNDTNEVFYVGKGKGGRAQSKYGRNPHWRGVVEKHGHTVEVCAKWPTEAEAFDHERFLIATFKQMGHRLVNLTDGGEGASGAKRTAEQVADIKDRLKRFYEQNPDVKLRIAAKVSAHRKAVFKGSATKRETKSRHQINAQMWSSQDMRDRLVAARKSQFATEEGRNKMALARGCKAFVCIETGKQFVNQTEAAKQLGTYPACIRKALSGKSAHANGFHLKYVEATK